MKRISMLICVLLLFPFIPLREDIKCVPEQTQTLVSFTIDDGYSSWLNIIDPILEKYDGISILKEHNISITGFINDLNIVDRELEWDDVRQLSETGRWYFGWHGTHHLDLTKLTKDEERKEISDGFTIFQEHSLSPPKTFCYPFGAYDFTAKLTVAEDFSTARSVIEGVNTAHWVQEHPMEIKVMRFFSDRDKDFYKNTILENIDKGTFIVFYFHTIDESIGDEPMEISSEEFQDLISWLVNQNIKIVSFEQGIEEMNAKTYRNWYSTKLDNPFDRQYVSQIPIPSRYWEMMFISANILGKISPPIGDLMLRYNTFLTTFMLLSLLFCLYVSETIPRKRRQPS